MISIIVAISEDWGIGKDNELLWHIPEDLKRFKRLTAGNAVIMGKRTWESLPLRPLPGRKNIVLTDDLADSFENCLTAYSIEEALSKCDRNEEIFIIGGGSVYRQFISIAERLYITHVHKNAKADVYFPVVDQKIWKVIEKEDHTNIGSDGIPYTYVVYERKGCLEIFG